VTTHVEPNPDEVAATVRKALYARSPMSRAEAEARLTGWDLPLGPQAIVIAARRLKVSEDLLSLA
jgi:hypothetical protein